MGVFFVLLFIPIMIQHVVVRGSNVSYEKRNKQALCFFFVFLTFLVMFRHENVGNDTKNYIYFFNTFSKMDWMEFGKSSLEVGYSYFNKIISLFSKEPQFFLAITAIATSLMIYPTYKRLCVDASLTIMLFCIMSTFVMMFSGIRQMLAIGLGFVAYEFVRTKKMIPYIIVVCIAMTFHTSAFMLAFMYPIYHARIKKKSMIIVVPVLAFIFMFNNQIFSFISLFIEQYTKYEGGTSETGAYTMLILFCIFVIFSFIIPNEEQMDNEIIGLRNFLLLSLIVQMFALLHNLAMRMNYYYIIFIPLLIPKIIEYSRTRWQQIATLSRIVMVIFFFLYFFLIKVNSDGNLHVFPYYFFWENNR